MPSISKKRNADGSLSWVAQVRLQGFKPVAKSFQTKGEADTWAKALERELTKQRERGAVREDLAHFTIAELVRVFLDDAEIKSLRYYAPLSDLLAEWVNLLGGERVLKLNVLKLREVRERLKKGPKKARAAATINRHLSAMRSCWNWGRAAGYVPQDLLWPSRLMLTEPKGRTRFLSDTELERLLLAAEDATPVMRAAIVVSIACGVRQSELLRLKWADIDFDQQRLRVLLSKNNESRTVFLPDSAAKVLRPLKRAKVLSPLVFTDAKGRAVDKGWITHRWKDIRSAAKLLDFRWHDLRHSCASFLAQQGANLLEIGSVLGHKSPSMTRRYSHLVEGAPVTGHSKLDEKLRGKP